MLYIGFSNYSNKIHAKIFCHRYKHCAPIVIKDETAVIYQFVHVNKVKKITIKKRDLKILQKHGWVLIKYSTIAQEISKSHYLTCVQFTKCVCGIKKLKIQTPFALFKYLNTK